MARAGNTESRQERSIASEASNVNSAVTGPKVSATKLAQVEQALGQTQASGQQSGQQAVSQQNPDASLQSPEKKGLKAKAGELYAEVMTRIGMGHVLKPEEAQGTAKNEDNGKAGQRWFDGDKNPSKDPKDLAAALGKNGFAVAQGTFASQHADRGNVLSNIAAATPGGQAKQTSAPVLPPRT